MAQFQQPGQAVSNQVSFTLSEREYVEAMLMYMKSRKTLVFVSLIMLISFGMTASTSSFVAIGIVAILALYLGLLFFIVRQSIKKQYQGMPQLHGVQTVQFSEEGVVWHNDYSLSRMKWPLYQKFSVNEKIYMLYQGPQLFNIIPRSAFADSEQEAAFRALLELHVKPAGKAANARRRREV